MLIVWGMNSAGLEVPAEVAAAVTTLLTFAVSYMVPSLPVVAK